MMSFFCYFCLKAGADRSRVRGTRQSKQFYSTILAFHHITKGKEAGRERERERERELHGVDFFSMCTSENIEGQNLQHRVRVEATVSHSGCVLSFVQVAIIREMKNGGSDLDRRSQSPQTMMVGGSLPIWQREV